MEEYFKGFEEDLYIPSLTEEGIKYTKVDKELANEAVFKGYLS